MKLITGSDEIITCCETSIDNQIIKIKIFRKFLHLEHLKIQLFNTTLALIRKCFFNLEMYIYTVL